MATSMQLGIEMRSCSQSPSRTLGSWERTVSSRMIMLVLIERVLSLITSRMPGSTGWSGPPIAQISVLLSSYGTSWVGLYGLVSPTQLYASGSASHAGPTMGCYPSATYREADQMYEEEV